MAEMIQGTVAITIPDNIDIPEEAGQLSPKEVIRIPKSRKGLGIVCEATTDAMQKNPERLRPPNVDAAILSEKGRMAEAIDQVIVDIEAILVKLKQANLLLDADAHTDLRKVLAFVRSQEKFDPRLTDLVPALISYFSHDKPDQDGASD